MVPIAPSQWAQNPVIQTLSTQATLAGGGLVWFCFLDSWKSTMRGPQIPNGTYSFMKAMNSY